MDAEYKAMLSRCYAFMQVCYSGCEKLSERMAFYASFGKVWSRHAMSGPPANSGLLYLFY